MTEIVIVGGADTGRAPMAAALLQRLLEAGGVAVPVTSAGVLGHDGEPAEPEARDTMTHMGLDIGAHQARTIDDTSMARAALLIAIDQGTARVLRARFPRAIDRIHALGDLAGRPRDIPDPFKMQIGAWMSYAREIEALLQAALPRITELALTFLPGPEGVAPLPGDRAPATPAGTPTAADPRSEAAARIDQVLRFVAEMPGVVDWPAARAQLEADLDRAAVPRDAGDLAAAYVGLLRAALAMTSTRPSPGQLTALREAVTRLANPIGQHELNTLSTRLAGWAAL